MCRLCESARKIIVKTQPEAYVTQNWQTFTEWKPGFPDLIAKWRRTIALLIIKTDLTDQDLVGQLIVAFMSTSILDIDDLMLLTVHNKHIGAQKILRTLFERIVT